MSFKKFITGLGLATAIMQPVQARLPNGIASGDTTQTSTVLWARSTKGLVKFKVKDGNQVVFKQSVRVDKSIIPAKLSVTGLAAGKTYQYEVSSPDGKTRAGSFKTAPADDTAPGLRFGVTGDWRGELAPYPAIKNVLAKNLDFFVKLGDTIYADFPSPAVPLEQAKTLVDYLRKQKEVYSYHHGRNFFANMQKNVSIFATIDDHEVINDFAGGALASSDTGFSETTGLINQTSLYNNGLRAFIEYNAIADRRYPKSGDTLTDGRPDLYRSQRYGKTASLHILDSRSFRDQELPDVSDITNPAQVGGFIAQSFDAGSSTTRTLLGKPQLDRLKDDLLAAQTDNVIWKFVMLPEPIQNLGVLAASDRYEGYASERSELLRFIDENGIKNVVFVTADIHGTLINDLTYQRREDILSALATSGNPLAAPQIKTSAFEISTGSVAFEPGFGDTVIGLLSAIPNGKVLLDQLFAAVGVSDLAGFNALPMPVKNAALESFLNAQLTQLGYTPLGLADNERINAKTLTGGNAALFSFGWTKFDIKPDSHTLDITTYGIPTYTTADLVADSAEVIARKPVKLSSVRVSPQP